MSANAMQFRVEELPIGTKPSVGREADRGIKDKGNTERNPKPCVRARVNLL